MTPQVNYDFSLAGKVAVVTGGASGIGAAIVEAYAAKDATVVVLDLAMDAAQRKVSDGSAAAAYGCDVTNEQSVIDVINAVHPEFGHIDVLVNSAGIAVIDSAEQLSVEAWDQTMAINLRGAFLVSQAATIALPGHLAYCASKFGLVGMTKVLALEWAGRGVTANTISPTVVMTPLAKELWDNPEGEALKAQIPTGRFAEPEEIAAVAVFLASDASSYCNGSIYMIDGGYVAA